MPIYTAQMRVGLPTDYIRADITVKSATEFRMFAPTWDMVNGYKSGALSQERYTELYHDIIKDVWDNNFAAWKVLLEYAELSNVVLVCFCPAGAFCHRVLLAQWAEIAGGALGYTNTEYKGELL